MFLNAIDDAMGEAYLEWCKSGDRRGDNKCTAYYAGYRAAIAATKKGQDALHHRLTTVGVPTHSLADGRLLTFNERVNKLYWDKVELQAALAAQSEESHKQVLELQGAIVTLETMRYRAEKAEEALAAREAEVGRLRSVLRQIEWISDYDKDAVCPMCNHEGKHDTDCELADALADHTP